MKTNKDFEKDVICDVAPGCLRGSFGGRAAMDPELARESETEETMSEGAEGRSEWFRADIRAQIQLSHRFPGRIMPPYATD